MAERKSTGPSKDKAAASSGGSKGTGTKDSGGEGGQQGGAAKAGERKAEAGRSAPPSGKGSGHRR